MNKDKLRSLCQKLSKETGISFNSIQTHFFLESILEKISVSDESNNFIFKGGFLLANVIGIRQRSTVDIDFLATGDPITPSDISYNYKSIFSDSLFKICAYNIETILAEKIHTVYYRGIFNSRSKDFYDIYILYRLKSEKINYDMLRNACQNTFKYRSTDFIIDSIINLISKLKSEKDIRIRWKNYQRRFRYAEEIGFDEVIDTVIEIVEKIK